MRQFGIMTYALDTSQQGVFITGNLNNMVDKYKDVDPTVFYREYYQPIITPTFSMLQEVEVWSFPHPVIATTIETAERLLCSPSPTKKLFYVIDMEWLYKQNISYDRLSEIYANDEIEFNLDLSTLELSEGLYFWSVQTIDTGFVASDWSESQSFYYGSQTVETPTDDSDTPGITVEPPTTQQENPDQGQDSQILNPLPLTSEIIVSSSTIAEDFQEVNIVVALTNPSDSQITVDYTILKRFLFRFIVIFFSIYYCIFYSFYDIFCLKGFWNIINYTQFHKVNCRSNRWKTCYHDNRYIGVFFF